MDIESVRHYCLALPLVTEDFPFDEKVLVFRVKRKIFAMVDLETPEWFVLKCDPAWAVELREAHSEIAPAFHMNKRHWNQINLFGTLSDALICQMIRHSYAQVVKKMTRKAQAASPEMLEVE